MRLTLSALSSLARLLLTSILVFPCVIQAAENALPWPTDASPRLTSSFAEPRSRHYHSGIDISTNGHMGYDLYSPVDGWVLRASASYYGYGKQLLIQGSDGRRYLYAHMLDFSDTLEVLLEEAQARGAGYDQVLWFEAGEIPFRRGEVVGRSGGSGAGPPHVHFEVRDGKGSALNPLRYGLQVEDSRPPVIQNLALFPRSREGRVSGSALPVVLDVLGDAPSYYLADTLRIEGDAQFALRCYDNVDRSSSRLAPYRMLLLVDGDTLFQSLYERVAFADTRWITAEINRWLLAERSQTFRNLWDVGPRLSFCADAGGRPETCHGVLRPRGLCHGFVQVTDPAGNMSSLSFVVDARPVEARESTECRRIDLAMPHVPGPGVEDVPQLYHSEDGVTLVLKLSTPCDSVYVESEASAMWPVTHYQQKYELVLPLKVRPDPQSLWLGLPHDGTVRYLAEYDLYPVSPERTEVLAWNSKELWAQLQVDAGSMPAEQLMLLGEGQPGALLVGPANLCLTSFARLQMPLPADLLDEDRTRAAICMRSGEKWEWCSGWTLSGDTLQCDVFNSGEYAVQVDRQAPRLRHQYPAATTRERQPLFAWRCQEDLSGVVHAELWLNSLCVYPRYDGDMERILWKPRNALEPGEYQLKLLVRDEAGNEATDTRTLQIVGN